MTTIPVRIFAYKATHLYKRRCKLVQYLKDNLNNIAEDAVDDHGDSIGSGMLDDLTEKRSARIWIAWLVGRPVAWGMLARRRRIDTKFQASVYVHPDFRRNGVGKRILNKMKTHAKIQKCSIVSQGWDARGKNFYSQNGISYACTWDFGS